MSDVATKRPERSPVAVASSESDATGGNRRQLDFRWFFGAYAVSIFGDQITLVAMPLVVFARTHSAFAVGIAASMQATSMLVLGLFAGALADRLRHRSVLIATDALRAGVLGLVALMVATSSTYSVGALYLAAFVLGALGVLHDAAAGATLPVIVGGRDLLMANGRLSGAEMAGNAGGPAVAGVLIAFGGAALAFASDALTFVLSALGIHQVRALRRRDERPADAEPASMTADIREGLRALWADDIVVKAVVLMAILNVAIVPVEAQFIPYAKTVLHTGAAGIGVFFAIGGVAGVVTAALLGRAQATRGDALVLGTALASGGVLLAGALPSIVAVGVTFILVGVGSVLAMSHWASLRQRRFPVRILGRVTVATRMVLFGVVPIAYLAGGALARSQGSQALFVAAGGVGLAACAWAWVVGLGRVRLDDVIAES